MSCTCNDCQYKQQVKDLEVIVQTIYEVNGNSNRRLELFMNGYNKKYPREGPNADQ